LLVYAVVKATHERKIMVGHSDDKSPNQLTSKGETPIIDEPGACNQGAPTISSDQARRVLSVKKTVCFTRENLNFVENVVIPQNKGLNRSTAVNKLLNVARKNYGY